MNTPKKPPMYVGMEVDEVRQLCNDILAMQEEILTNIAVMAMQDYTLINEPPIRARAILKRLEGTQQ